MTSSISSPGDEKEPNGAFTVPGAERQEGRVSSSEDMSIYWQRWLPKEPPKAVLFFVHGLAEHSGRYGFPVQHFVPRGYACWGLDLRGHGQSSGRRVHVRSFDDYAQDVSAVLEVVQDHHGDLPMCIVGHSMGGLIALRYFLDNPKRFFGAILSSPALEAHPNQQPPRLLRKLAKLVSRLAPRTLFPSDLDVNTISRSPDVVEAYRSDPLVSCKVSARWFTAIEATMIEVRGRTQELSQPVLMMQSAADVLVNPAATRSWAEEAPAQWLDYVEWPGFFHEMFNEPERLDVFRRMETWLDGLLD